MNRMNEVFDLVGVKPNEQFKVNQMNGVYLFDRMGKLWKSVEHTKVEILNVDILDFLRGILTIEEVSMENKIEEMLEMQKALDAAIYKEHDVEFDKEKCKMAILDEIGELNHELKSEWCWWKKSQKPVDRNKALEELCDLWHFVLSYHYQALNRAYDRKHEKYFLMHFESMHISSMYALLVEHPCLENLVCITYKLGFEIDEVYNAYIEKNKVNYERLANNY